VTIELPYKWTPRTYQESVWRHMQGNQEGLRAVCVWHRRAGKDLTAMNLCACKAHERVGLYWHMLPTYKQGRAIVWNGVTRDGRKFLSHFPRELVASENQTEMRVTFKNGSIYQVVGTDNINLLVGTNPVGVVFSEYSLHDPGAWDYIRPILAENGGWALFIYTARGKNHGWHLLEMARKNRAWFSEVLVAGSGPTSTRRPDGSPVVTDEIIQAERDSNMPEEMIQQEFFCSFEAPMVGAYYSKQMSDMLAQDRICSVPWEPRLPVETAWDLGVDDATSIWFIQRYGMEFRAIDYYENSGEGLAHYAKVLKERPYAYGRHHAPHDIEVREFSSGRSRIEAGRSMGIKFTTVQRHEVEDGIEAVRNLLPSFWMDAGKCERAINGLREYRKEWDDDRKVFRATPLHNWASHPADAMRIFAWGYRSRPKHKKPPQERTEDGHDYLTGRDAPEEAIAMRQDR
jgi:hypothetical protein